jgi:FkbM family methyltransferase
MHRTPYNPVSSRRDRLLNLLRPVLEFLGIAWLSRPSLNGLDTALERLLPQHGGWFVEAGAYDGFQQSNSYYFARMKGWRGVLIEPVPHLAAQCRKRRPESKVYECALGAPERSGSTVKLRFAGLMTNVCGALGDEITETRRAQAGLAVQGLPVEQRVVEVPLRTLTEVLIESGTPSKFDLLSLDVEGHEAEVLKGFDLDRHQARLICIEARRTRLEEVRERLSARYEMKEVLHEGSEHGDYLFRLR